MALFLLITLSSPAQRRLAFAEELGTWRFPLDGWRIAYHEREDGLALENTRYGVRNLDLFLSGPDYITCFGVAGTAIPNLAISKG